MCARSQITNPAAASSCEAAPGGAAKGTLDPMGHRRLSTRLDLRAPCQAIAVCLSAPGRTVAWPSVRTLCHALIAGALLICNPATALETGDTGDREQSAERASEAAAPPLKPAANVDLSDVVVDQEAIPDVPESTLEQAASPSDAAGSADDLADDASEFEAQRKLADNATRESSAPAGQGEEQPALILLGTEVPPGTTTRLGWSPKVGFMGVSTPTPVLVINGVSPGPTLCLTAAVLGDESNGIETVRRVLYSIDAQKLSGAIIGVPIVNIAGFRAGSRYLPDRRDLNRYFPGNSTGSAASRIAASFFQEVVSQCDSLIDLHTGSFGRTNLQQLRADLTIPEVKSLAEKMGRMVVVQSRGTKGTLRRAATERGIAAVK